jgi:hypothetical protein
MSGKACFSFVFCLSKFIATYFIQSLWKLYTSESKSEIIWQFWSVVLEKDREDRLNWLSKKCSITYKQKKRNILHTIKWRDGD